MEGLGRLLGAIGAFLGAMLAFLGRSWALLGRLFGLMGASGLIWGGVWEALGGSWEGLGSILGESWEDFGRTSSFQRPPRCLANSLGVTMRGGLRPLRVLEVVPQVPPRGFTERSSFRLGFAHPVEDRVPFGFGASNWHFFRIFRIFLQFFGFFGTS